MRYLLPVFFSVFFSLSASAAPLAPSVKTLENNDPSRILFLGNSYMFYGDGIHSHVKRLVKAAGFHQGAIKYKLATISGARLSDHCLECLLKDDRLRVKGPFDLVIMQDQSSTSLSASQSANFLKTVTADAKIIRMAQGAPALYMPPAYVAPNKRATPEMTEKNRELYTKAGNAVGALVIPAGLAFAEAYRQRPDIKLHKSFDGSHPTILGTYLAALTVYASVYNASPIGNPYTYFGRISQDDALFLQRVADKTVKDYFGR
jgi:hypothetical protein